MIQTKSFSTLEMTVVGIGITCNL